MSGLLVAAPASGSGKTTVTLALIAALRRRGVPVRSAKAGPDYIDPAFHRAASGAECVNLDPWAMRPELLQGLADRQRCAAGPGGAFVVEAMMGLFDGAADGSGSPADLAAALGLRTVLVIDCARQSHSLAALVRGFATHRPDVPLAGVILNRVGSERHAAMLREALEPLGVAILAILPRREDLALPSRHLGLVQAVEHPELGALLARAADWLEQNADLAALYRLAAPFADEPEPGEVGSIPPFGQRIALAQDEAFAFAYPHLLEGWREAGAEIIPFSPLANEAPDLAADAVFLPGGYPELHAGRLAAASAFRGDTKAAAARGARIYGECGGYMVLGESIRDAQDAVHPMLGLLPLRTSFARRRLHLGYRHVEALPDAPLSGRFQAHEFHYATIEAEGPAEPLFNVADARGEDLGLAGLRIGAVGGSFLHLIDRAR